MNDPHTEHDVVIRTLHRSRLCPPSPGLKEKILGQSHRAWAEPLEQTDAVPWTRPVLRLAASIAVVVALSLLEDAARRRAVSRWSPLPTTPAVSSQARSVDPGTLDGLELIPRFPDALAAFSNPMDVTQLVRYRTDVRRLLDEPADPGGVSAGPGGARQDVRRRDQSNFAEGVS